MTRDEMIAEVAASQEWSLPFPIESLTDSELLGACDDLANGDDLLDGLAERRYWSSPRGRREAAEDCQGEP